MTLKKALEQAINAGYLYVTDRGTNADGELWCIDEFIAGLNPDADDAYDPHTYALEGDTITEYDHDGQTTGWYLQCSEEC